MINNFIVQNGIQFPDNTVQNSQAWTNSPVSLTGSTNDTSGSVAYNSNGIYYCFQDFVPQLSYDIVLYLATGDSGEFYTNTNVYSHDITNWVVSNAHNTNAGTISVPDGTVVNSWTYNVDGSYLTVNNALTNITTVSGPGSGGISSFTVTQPTILPIIWQFLAFSASIATGNNNDIQINHNGGLTGSNNLKYDGYTFSVNGGLTINNVPYSFTSSQGGINTILNNDGNGNLNWVNSNYVSQRVVSMNSGDTYSVPNGTNIVYLNLNLSSWPLDVYNVLMPSAPVHDQPFSISTNQDITEFNLVPNGGQSINSSPTTLHINSSTISCFCSYTYNFIDSIWYRNG